MGSPFPNKLDLDLCCASLPLVFLSMKSTRGCVSTWTSVVAAAWSFLERSEDCFTSSWLFAEFAPLHFVALSFPGLNNCGLWNVDIHLQSLNTLLQTCLIWMRSRTIFSGSVNTARFLQLKRLQSQPTTGGCSSRLPAQSINYTWLHLTFLGLKIFYMKFACTVCVPAHFLPVRQHTENSANVALFWYWLSPENSSW